MIPVKYIITNWEIGIKTLFARPLTVLAGGITLLGITLLELVFCYSLYIASDTKLGYELFLFLGFWQIANSLYGTFFAWSHDRMSEIILDGGLDFLLLRPANAFYTLSFGELDLSSLFTLPVAIFITCFAIQKLEIVISIAILFQIILYIIVTSCIIFLLFNVISLTALFSEGLSNILPVAETWVQFGSRPAKYYKGLIFRFLTIIFPIIETLNIPALLVVNGKLYFSNAFQMISVLSILLLLNYLVWILGIKRYKGASS